MKIKFPMTLCSILLISYSNSALASNCTEGKIAFYLKNGFTHEQIVRLCTNNSQPAPTSISRVSPPLNNTKAPAKNNYEKDQDYFKTVIESNSASLSTNRLSFERRECAVYGDMDMTHTRDKVCINTQTHITLEGLQILRATKGIPLLKKQELLVKGDITREYLSDTSQIHSYKMDEVKKQLPVRPITLHIPIKMGIDPQTVAKRLKSLL